MKTVVKLAMASLSLAAAAAWSAPITFNTALPVHEGGYVWREQLIFMQSADDPTAARRDMQVTGLVSVLGWALV